jgi:3-hydroxyisobutyrate dehydrogenase-like beta-hydroxyacid dehydrogenase
MKIAFIGLGRMGQAMAKRILDAGHDLAVYNRTPDKIQALAAAGAKVMGSIEEAARYGEGVFTMLADDAALADVARQKGGLLQSLPKGGIHICAGTHSVGIIRELEAAHAAAGQILLATPMLGRPEAVASGQANIVLGGRLESLAHFRPLFEAIGRRSFEAGASPAAAAAIKIANNFVLGCAIEAMGLFAAPAYKVYGKIITEERYQPAGQRAVLGLKDANLALAAGEAVGVPLPSGNVWRDRLVGAVAHGEGEYDWAVMARDQARASGLE